MRELAPHSTQSPLARPLYARIGQAWSRAWVDRSDPLVRRQQLLTVLWMRNLALALLCVLLLLVGWGLRVSLPWLQVGVILTGLVALTAITAVRLRRKNPVGGLEVFAQLFADLAAFTLLLYFTGGVTNPFVSLYLPLLGLAAALLPWGQVAVLATFSVAAYSVLMNNYFPLVLANPADGVHFHLIGMWLNFLVSVVILVAFVARLSSFLRDRDQALAKAQTHLANESKLAALGNQAASIAHQLGTPVSTIATVVADWQDDPAMAHQQADMAVLQAQVQSITNTLARIRAQVERDHHDSPVWQKLELSQWLDQEIAAWRNRHPACEVQWRATGQAVRVNIELLALGLGVLLDNAAQSHLRAGVEQPVHVKLNVSTTATTQALMLAVEDSGPGMASELLSKAGQQVMMNTHGQGMGLFLLANLLDRAGGARTFQNTKPGFRASLSMPVTP